MLRGFAPALHALKLDARVRQSPWAALLPCWTISIIDAGKPKGNSANVMFEWLSEVPLWWLPWDLGMLCAQHDGAN